MKRPAKKHVVEIATQQSQRAQALTASLRRHGWKTYWSEGERRVTDNARRRDVAEEALRYAFAIARDGDIVASWVAEWARSQGVDVDKVRREIIG